MNATSRSLAAVLCLSLTLAACAEDPDEGRRHIEIAQSGYAAFSEGDMETVLALMAPELVWREAESLPYGGVYHSPDAVMEHVFAAVVEDFTDFSAVPQHFFGAGDIVTVLGEYRGTNIETGRELVSPFVHIWRFEGELLVEFWQFTDTALWLDTFD